MKILATVFLVAVSALFSMAGFIHIIAFDQIESTPIIMLVSGVLTLIVIAGTLKRRI